MSEISDPNQPTDSPVSGNATILNQGIGEPAFPNYGPIIDALRLRDEYLFGVPLTSPLTGQVMTDGTLKQIIRKAIGDFETSVRIPLTPVQITDKFNFERADDMAFGTRQFTRWPVLQIIKFYALFPGRIESQVDQNGDIISGEVPYPTSWVNFQSDSGVFTITPTSSSLYLGDTSVIATESFRGIIMGAMKHWPNLWRITYRAGFDFDKIPDIVNDLIGTMAALRVLSMVAPAIFSVNSYSLGIDGMSQSTLNAGPQWLQARVQELIADRDRLIGQIRAHYGTDMIFAVM